MHPLPGNRQLVQCNIVIDKTGHFKLVIRLQRGGKLLPGLTGPIDQNPLAFAATGID